jgi:hypothetical protein
MNRWIVGWLFLLWIGGCGWWQAHGAPVVDTGLCILLDALEGKSLPVIVADCRTDIYTVVDKLDEAASAASALPPPANAEAKTDDASPCVLREANAAGATEERVIDACHTTRASVESTLAAAQIATQKSAKEREMYHVSHRGGP